MIIDVTGVVLTPANFGKYCKGNGKHFDNNGILIECCCDECDYLLCCTSDDVNCSDYTDTSCPRKTE